MAFHFERPGGFAFRAGQHAHVTLTDPPETDDRGPRRTFTIASAPHEHELAITTRMRDTAFKRALESAQPGLNVDIDRPKGEMVLHEDAARPAVFLAGGIGITPFLSMARHAVHISLPHRIFLFYSNRRPEDAAFLDELRGFETRNSNYRLIATMTKAGKSSRRWTGETDHIGRDMLERHLRDVLAPVYYYAGPPAMVAAMHDMLAGLGVAEDDMRSEDFDGY